MAHWVAVQGQLTCCLTPHPTLQVLAAQHDWPALQALAGRAAGDRKLGLSMEHFIAAAR